VLSEVQIMIISPSLYPAVRDIETAQRQRTSRLVGEHEGIIGKVLGRQFLRAHHHLEWINLNH
jgi:hypothetical protein